MKKIFAYTAIVSLLSLLVISCGPTAQQKEEARVRRSKTPNQITWDTISMNKAEPLDVKSVKASGTLDIKFIVPKEYENTEIKEAIQKELNYVLGEEDAYINLSAQDAVKKYTDNYIANYKKEAKDQLPLWNKINGGKEVFSYTKDIDTEVLYNEANLVSYQIRVVEMKGDSTSIVNVKNMVFDLTNGKRLTEQDIFDKGYKEELNRILIRQIVKDNEVKDIEALQEKGYWGVADLAANDNFIVTRDGITYTFNPDEYSDAELGVLKVFVDYDNLDDILKEDSPISVLLID